MVRDVGLAGGRTGAVFGGALVARVILRTPFADVDAVNAGARGFVSGGGPFPSLPTPPFGAAFDGRKGWGWFVSASAMAASLRGWSGAMFSCVAALRLSVFVAVADDIKGPAMVVVGGM